MQWSLSVLLLMGQCSFLTCRLYKYHFVNQTMNWTEAQQHCRDTYTDLATVTNMTDVQRLGKKHPGAWIGLYNHTDANATWHWSLPGMEYKQKETKWAPKEPNGGQDLTLCGAMNKAAEWIDDICQQVYKFVCYKETNKPNEKFKLIDEKQSWLQAQSFCRDEHTDLVSGWSQWEAEEFNRTYSSRYDSPSVWIGLFRDTWKWSDGSSFSFRHWDPTVSHDGNRGCAMTVTSGKWSFDKCHEQKPFFCYDDKVILIKRRMNWENALYHCQKHYGDLVSIGNLDEQRWVQEKAKMADTDHVWLGLRYTCTLDFWFWVDSRPVKYQNWNSSEPSDDCNMSGAMATRRPHKWFKKIDDEERFNFICSKS